MDSITGGCACAHETGSAITQATVCSLYEALQQVPDSRGKRGRRYPAALVLTLLLVAKMTGEQTIAGIAQWVSQRKELLAQWLPLVRIPCANTYRYICAHVDAQALLAAATSVLGASAAAVATSGLCASPLAAEPAGAVPPPSLRHLACDGKEVRGSYRLTIAGVQSAQGVFGIYEAVSGRMQALLPIEKKGCEPQAFRQWLKEQEAGKRLCGSLLTADALHTQTAVCKAIRCCEADYLLIAKRNQRQLREDIRFLFSQAPDFWFPERQTRRVAVGHGRIEVCQMRVSSELNGYLADRWPAVQQVFQVERTVTRRGRSGTCTTTEVVCGLTSVPASRASPEQLLDWLRAHWRIENRSHWRRDATLGEDRLQLSCKPAAVVMAALNCIILALFDHFHVTNCRQAMRTYNAHPERALALLCQPF